ncbi:hypothetical protein [Pseudonocardia sp.]|jgi:hypothetical protein|uniref:hypothetical protein n=1 Tax=Pseudonocardia sp. TaxID=60912 RepID=UPI0031FE0387
MRTTTTPTHFPDIEPATIEFSVIPAQALDLREYWTAEEPAVDGPVSWAEAEELVRSRSRRGGVGRKFVVPAVGAVALLGLGVRALFDAGLLPF